MFIEKRFYRYQKRILTDKNCSSEIHSQDLAIRNISVLIYYFDYDMHYLDYVVYSLYNYSIVAGIDSMLVRGFASVSKESFQTPDTV